MSFSLKTLLLLLDFGHTSKIVHGDLFVRPTVKMSKVKERSNFKQAQLAKVAVSMCWP